jgi:hypothetical protein
MNGGKLVHRMVSPQQAALFRPAIANYRGGHAAAPEVEGGNRAHDRGGSATQTTLTRTAEIPAKAPREVRQGAAS